jgi:hypothetical protein
LTSFVSVVEVSSLTSGALSSFKIGAAVGCGAEAFSAPCLFESNNVTD